MTKTLLVTNGQ